MNARIELDGTTFSFNDLDTINNEIRQRIIAGEGTFLWSDGHPLAGTPMHPTTASRMRLQVIRGSKPKPKPEFESVAPEEIEERRYLVPGAWPHDTHYTLGGPQKHGKTTVVADLVATLLVPDKKFLGWFPPVEGTDMTVWVINCETPSIDFENALNRAGIADRHPYSTFYLDHLREIGGARRFDLTDRALFDEWADKMLACFECDGTDFSTPDVVIVDGVTAIAHSLGKSPENYYGPFFVAFRQLMDLLGIPNSLIVAHTGLDGRRLLGGVESSANQDGLWTIDAGHRFSIEARIGGTNLPPTKIVLEDGQPRLRASAAKSAPDVSTPKTRRTAASPDAVAGRVLAYVAAENAAGHMPRIGDVRSAVGGDTALVDRTVRALVAEQELIRDGAEGRGSVKTYRVPRTGQDAAVAEDGKDAE